MLDFRALIILFSFYQTVFVNVKERFALYLTSFCRFSLLSVDRNPDSAKTGMKE